MKQRCDLCKDGGLPRYLVVHVTGRRGQIVSLSCARCEVPLSNTSMKRMDEREIQLTLGGNV